MNMDYRVSMIFFSRPGIGKTTLLTTAARDPRTSPALFLDWESNTLSVRSRIKWITIEELESISPEPYDKVYGLHMRNWQDFETILELLETEELPVRSVLIDSLTEIGYLNLREACEKHPKVPIKAQDAPERVHYLRHNTQMLRLVRRFRDLPQHIFFSAQLLEDEDETSGMKILKMSMIGKLKDQLGYLVNSIGYYFMNKQGERVLSFTPTNRIVAKDGTENSMLTEDIENPTITKLLDLIEEGGET